MSTIADLIVEGLRNAGVARIHGLPGDSLNGLTDALRRNPSMAWEHYRHEEAAAFAAAGEAATTGSLAACAGSCGPGNLHLVNGLYEAQRSRVPVLAIAAHIPGSEIGTGYFQETHPEEVFRECSVFCELASSPDQFPHLLDIALRTAVERSGVSVLVVPGNVLLHRLDHSVKAATVLPTAPVVRPGDPEIERAAAVLNDAERITVLAGAGCAGAHDQLVQLAGALRAPVVHTLRGKEHVEYDNPYDVGMTGLLGFTSGYRAMEQCDTLLMLGTDFPYRQFLPEHATTVQVDLRGEQIGRRTRVDLALVGTVRDTAEALLPKLAPRTGSRHLDSLRDHYVSARAALDRLAVDDRNRAPIHPQYVVKVVDELATEDAVFIPDVGSPVVWAARYLTMNGRRRLIGSFNHGSMANALPQAIGAQSAFPQRQVVALSGDGGLAMMLGDLITLKQQRHPVKIVVFNNGALSFVELEMKAEGMVNFGTDLDNPNFADVATTLGIHGSRVEHPADLPDALRAAFAHPGPALVEVMTARQELSIPPTITFDQVKGFALYAARTVLSGRGDELLELARTNVVRRL
ncbi:ubiquinone-dependent pyruvate dehydrogenase [Streptomyces xylophagus]|uniref:ubiquinone-dependent pyruvate dehydrogenase n=1 Tax=Streptomyces xylophagus TaxID=285514 RepID=UPI0005BBF61A|nr:ubiquinone-dependent pyruvate dehydrogenase [Streptomyces xylophagus]